MRVCVCSGAAELLGRFGDEGVPDLVSVLRCNGHGDRAQPPTWWRPGQQVNNKQTHNETHTETDTETHTHSLYAQESETMKKRESSFCNTKSCLFACQQTECNRGHVQQAEPTQGRGRGEFIRLTSHSL